MPCAIHHDSLSFTQRRAFRNQEPMRLYVGGFPYETTKEELTMLFSEVGEVQDIHLPFDKVTGRPRGFGFLEMPDDAARAAIERFHGIDFGGRTLTVNEAQPRAERPAGAGGGNPRFGGGDRNRAPRRDDWNNNGGGNDQMAA